MNVTSQWKSYTIGSSRVDMRRLESGVIDIRAENALDLQKALGFAHALDRLMQIVMTWIVGRGGLSEYLIDSEEAYAFDFLVRKLGIARYVADDLPLLTPEAATWTAAYCEGVNAYIEQKGMPLFLRYFDLKKTHWHITDTMLIIKVLSYLGITQQQERIERLILHAIRGNVPLQKLKKIFKLDHVDEDLIELLKKVHLSLPFFESRMRFQPLQNMMSNNWAVASHKSFSDCPLLCADPHVQVNRVPSSWYEVIGRWGKENYRVGITLPGFPGWMMGRTAHLAASFTYGMLDTVDFFIEEIKRGQYRRGDEWIPLQVREERIHRKRKGNIALYFFETDIGVIERKDSTLPVIEDGYYLSLAWAAFRQGPSKTLNCLMHLWSCQNVDEAMMYLWGMTLPTNWVLADSKGNIALQQAGCVPKRKKAGLLPLPAWEKENLWEGYYFGTDLVSEVNPERGFVLSANDNKDIPGLPTLNSIDFPSYRFRRISQFLSQNKKFTIDDMKALQRDCYSVQAEEFMDQIRPWIPDTSPGRILKAWDLCYDKDSQGATLFEKIYQDILNAIFIPVFGKQVWETYGPGNNFFGGSFGHFDQIALSNDPSWFGGEGKDALLQRIVTTSLSYFDHRPIPTWGQTHEFFMNYLLFDGKLPKIVGFDAGPIQLNGSRATVDTLNILQEGERKIVCAASYRMITDLKDSAMYTALAGGVSEKRRSKYFTSDIERWKNGNYKKISCVAEDWGITEASDSNLHR